jgi:anti-sigma regulatory factor (Ser/Thr protein kinase)
MEIHTMHEVTKAAHKAEGFCIRHGHDEKISNHIALCVEEMAANTIQHGFTMDNRHHDLSVRLLHKNAGLVLRFRDDCGAFDPVRYIPKDEEDALGLRLVLAFATDARYTYAMNLNNVCIRIRDEK